MSQGPTLTCSKRHTKRKYQGWHKLTELQEFSQGWVIRRIRKIRRMVFDPYFTVLNKLGRIIRLQNLPFSCLFGQFPPQQRPFSELPVLFYIKY
jgi:hypothetical protein